MIIDFTAKSRFASSSGNVLNRSIPRFAAAHFSPPVASSVHSSPPFLGPSLSHAVVVMSTAIDEKIVITIDETIFRVLHMFFTARFRNHFTRSGCYATFTT